MEGKTLPEIEDDPGGIDRARREDEGEAFRAQPVEERPAGEEHGPAHPEIEHQRRPPRQSANEILQLLSINLIVTGTLFLISAGFSAEQIAPGLGLFGTIAGYVLGRRMGEAANAKTPAPAADAP